MGGCDLPTYTYACTACGAEIERRQSFSDARLTVCESCGGTLRRLLHPVGVIFKGSGFYNTDYKNASNGSKPGQDGGADKPKDGDASKPADGATSETKSTESTKSEPSKSESAASSTPSKTESSAAATSKS
jgi:putative FmdB family regulatory protein